MNADSGFFEPKDNPLPLDLRFLEIDEKADKARW